MVGDDEHVRLARAAIVAVHARGVAKRRDKLIFERNQGVIVRERITGELENELKGHGENVAA